MPGRTSTRQAAAKANQAFSQNTAGSKRKASSTKGSAAKKEKKEEGSKQTEYKQPTVTEESDEQEPSKEVWSEQQTNEQPKEHAAEVSKANEKPREEPQQKPEEHPSEGEHIQTETANGHQEQAAAPEKKAQVKTSTSNGAGTAIQEDAKREEIIPSNLLEKGIIYFFYRPRINVEDPHSINDVARSFFVLRPTPKGAKLRDGPIPDENNCRLLMLPKKTYPASGKDRDMGFVEKAKVSLKTLRDSFMASETYQTKTRGERTTPEARPYAEGVYALTRTTRASHLAYILTIPSEPGDVQQNFGLRHRGSFVLQSKNPRYPGPANAQLPKGPEYPEHLIERFRDLRWAPAEPEFLDYPNAQILLVGEAQDGFGKAGVTEDGEKKPNEKQPAEELEKFEEENEERVDNLDGDDTVFDDLGIDAKQYAQVPTTWD